MNKYTLIVPLFGCVTYPEENFEDLQQKILKFSKKAKSYTSVRINPKTFDMSGLEIDGEIVDLIGNYIGMGNRGFFISSKVKNIVEKFKIAPHIYFPAKLTQDGNEYDYYYIFFTEDFITKVDFKKTKIFKVRNEKVKIDLEDYSDFFEINNQESGGIDFEEIYLKDYSYDMFQIYTLHSEFFLSEKLIEALKKESVTGIYSNKVKYAKIF